MHHSSTAHADHSSFRHSGQFRLFCALAVMAGWLLWIEHRAPAASMLSCVMFVAAAAWFGATHADDRAQRDENLFDDTYPEMSR